MSTSRGSKNGTDFLLWILLGSIPSFIRSDTAPAVSGILSTNGKLFIHSLSIVSIMVSPTRTTSAYKGDQLKRNTGSISSGCARILLTSSTCRPTRAHRDRVRGIKTLCRISAGTLALARAVPLGNIRTVSESNCSDSLGNACTIVNGLSQYNISCLLLCSVRSSLRRLRTDFFIS